MSSTSSSSDEEDTYGPALPPHLLERKRQAEVEVEEESVTKSPAVIGPSLPPGFKPSSIMTQPEQLEEQVDPLRETRVTSRFAATTDAQPVRPVNENEVAVQGRDDDEEEDEEDDIGPYPPDHPKSKRRYEQSYSKPVSSSSEKPKREEWMLIPPKNKPISNLASRKFLPRSLETRNDEDDETNEKQDLKEDFQTQLIEKRDELMSNLLGSESSSGRSAESLLEIHRKNLKKRKLEEAAAGGESEKKERRPFDRDSDLKIHGMNADDKQRFIKRATSELQGRFAHGKKAGKFL